MIKFSGIPTVTDLLEETRLFEIDQAAAPVPQLENEQSAMEYDLFVVFGSPESPSPIAQINFERSLSDGAGLLILGAQKPHGPGWPLFERASILLTKPSQDNEQMSDISIHYLDYGHPVTRGGRDFNAPGYLPEILHGEPQAPYVLLADARRTDRTANSTLSTPAMLGSHHGRGRIFHWLPDFTPLADCDPFRRVISRAAEWAATGNVIDF